MSFAGIDIFVKNLDTLFESDKFGKATSGEQLDMGYCLFNSKYGVGVLGKVEELKGGLNEK